MLEWLGRKWLGRKWAGREWAGREWLGGMPHVGSLADSSPCHIVVKRLAVRSRITGIPNCGRLTSQARLRRKVNHRN